MARVYLPGCSFFVESFTVLAPALPASVARVLPPAVIFTCAASDRLNFTLVGLPWHFFDFGLHFRPPVALTPVIAGAVVSGGGPLPGAWTITLPCMLECTLQRYVNVPGVLKVWSKVSPGGWSTESGARIGSESNVSAWFGSAVTEWFVSGPAQCQVTVSPGAIVTGVGLKAKF